MGRKPTSLPVHRGEVFPGRKVLFFWNPSAHDKKAARRSPGGALAIPVLQDPESLRDGDHGAGSGRHGIGGDIGGANAPGASRAEHKRVGHREYHSPSHQRGIIRQISAGIGAGNVDRVGAGGEVEFRITSDDRQVERRANDLGIRCADLAGDCAWGIKFARQQNLQLHRHPLDHAEVVHACSRQIGLF